MSRYDYRCPACGLFELSYPIGTAPARRPCPTCTAPAARLLSPPALLARTPAARAVAADRRSAHEPAVVRAVPDRPRRAVPRSDPRWARLPRP